MIRRLLDRVTRPLDPARPIATRALRTLLDTEWIVTNGLGGYASSTMAGVITRRYHGILVAALPNPLGRVVMLNHLGERLVIGDRATFAQRREERAAGRDRPGGRGARRRPFDSRRAFRSGNMSGAAFVSRSECSCRTTKTPCTSPIGSSQGSDVVPRAASPAVHFRGYEDPVNTPRNAPERTRYIDGVGRRCARDRPPRPDASAAAAETESTATAAFRHIDSSPTSVVTSEFVYPVEESRGYEFRGTLWTPGHFEVDARTGRVRDIDRVGRA